VLPVSFFESAGPVFFNAITIIDADGAIAGHYRKSHIPACEVMQQRTSFQ